jgi:anti-CRISPR protein AcrIC5
VDRLTTKEKKMNIQQMAAEMNVHEADLKSFIGCLRVWTDKGFTVEEALKKHQEIVSIWATDPQALIEIVKPDVVKAFYPTKITYNGQEFEMDAARQLMDDDICEAIHGTVETDQEFFDAYVKAHEEEFGEEFVIN